MTVKSHSEEASRCVSGNGCSPLPFLRVLDRLPMMPRIVDFDTRSERGVK